MRSLVAFLLVACSSSARGPEPTPPVVVPGHRPQAVGTAAGPRPLPTRHAPRDASAAPHGGAIHMFAMAPEAPVVLSADELGGARLWPSLDGKAEPRVIDMPVGKQLAIGQRSDGYSAVALDEAGGLYIAKLDGDARQLAHTTIAADPPVSGMVMTSLGLLVWRSDQVLVLIDGDGATLAKLPAEPRQRVRAVATNGSRAIALLDRDNKKNELRWVTLEPTLAWGPWVKLDGALAGAVDFALSPNGQRIAALQRTDRGVAAVVYEASTGKSIAHGTVASGRAEVGFVDNDHVALGGSDGVSWIDLTAPDGNPSASTPTHGSMRTRAALATGHGVAVSALNGDLAISTPSGTEYLGYETVSPRIAEVGPSGQIAIGVGDHILVLDDELKLAATPFTGLAGTMAQLRWLGEQDWLLEGTNPQDQTMQIALVSASGSTDVVRKGLKEVQILHYEPTTQLVTLSFGAASEVARFDRAARRLDHITKVARSSPYEQLMFVPVAPKLAGGVQLVQIAMRDRTTLKWLRDPRALDKPSATVVVDGPYAGADRAGRIYVWRNTPGGQLELVVYANGKPLHTLPNTGPVALWPEPSGKRYIEVSQSAVALYSLDGKQQWFQSLGGVQEALWLSDGAIAVISAGGIARLDPQSGAVSKARCGWRFGRAPKPHPPTPRVEPLCAQLRR